MLFPFGLAFDKVHFNEILLQLKRGTDRYQSPMLIVCMPLPPLRHRKSSLANQTAFPTIMKL